MPPEILPPLTLTAKASSVLPSVPPDLASDLAVTPVSSVLDDLSRRLVARVRRFLTPLVLAALSLLNACRPSLPALPDTIVDRACEHP